MHLSFDFDYTLADSSDGTIACADFALRELAMAVPSASNIRKTVGLSLEKTFEVLTGAPSTSRNATEFKRLFLQHAEHVMLGHIHLYNGTPAALKALKEEGHYISIVSTKRRERIEEAIERDGLRSFIDDVVGGGCVLNKKPDPEGLLLAMSRSSHVAQETIFVGDSVSDGECAHRAGVDFVGVLSGQTLRDDLLKWNPVSVLREITEVPGLISSLGVNDSVR